MEEGIEEDPTLDLLEEDFRPSNCLQTFTSILDACLVTQLFLRLTLRDDNSPHFIKAFESWKQSLMYAKIHNRKEMGNLQVFQGDRQNCQHQSSSWLKSNLPAKAKHLIFQVIDKTGLWLTTTELHMADFASKFDGPNASLYRKPKPLDYSTRLPQPPKPAFRGLRQQKLIKMPLRQPATNSCKKRKSIQKANLAVKQGAHISPYTEFLMCHPSRIPRSRDPNNLKKTVASELLKDEIIVVHARNLLIVRAQVLKTDAKKDTFLKETDLSSIMANAKFFSISSIARVLKFYWFDRLESDRRVPITALLGRDIFLYQINFCVIEPHKLIAPVLVPSVYFSDGTKHEASEIQSFEDECGPPLI
ncbi:hypothetical protein RDI58_023795 [Solanum bulbocastanum]|uniref:Uncharacterized protein n=1 Tax=Solanum bulbocastanum TaxID=147425 RepID=A0AAN8SWE2_SOLBU